MKWEHLSMSRSRLPKGLLCKDMQVPEQVPKRDDDHRTCK